MRNLSMLLIAVLALATTIPAQEMPAPAKELAKFDVMLGNWQFKGSVVMGAGAEPMDWNAVSTAKRILGGFFVQDDVRVDFAKEAGMPSLIFRTIYGWDEHAKQYYAVDLSNNGPGDKANVYWTADGKLTSASIMKREPGVIAERAVTTFAKDRWSFRVEWSVDGGPFFVHVEGSGTRGGPGFDVTKAPAVAMAPPPEQMKKMRAGLGRWSLEGSVSPMPGMDVMEISGTQKVFPILGGHVQMTDIFGDPMEDGGGMAYRGQMYIFWNESAQTFDTFSFSNFGEAGFDRMLASSVKKQVYVSTMFANDVPQAFRTVCKFNDDMSVMTVKVHRAAGDHDPDLSFDATFKKLKEVGQAR